MDVVRSHIHAVDDNPVLLRSLDERLFKEVHSSWEFEGVAPVFWAPLKMELI